MPRKKKEQEQPSYTVQQCTFTNQPPSELSISAIEKLAEAANNNAIAIQDLAKAIKGSDFECMLKIGG